MLCRPNGLMNFSLLDCLDDLSELEDLITFSELDDMSDIF